MLDPIETFIDWLAQAEKTELNDPNATSLATCTKDGRPSVRMVLLKGVDTAGFVFYTNLESRKALELQANPFAALCFHWKSLRKQVRIEGAIKEVSPEEADEYFHSRPRISQIGAWASKQSQPLADRFELEKRVAEYTLKFAIGEIPRPPHWSGFRLLPEAIEFWQDKPYRLHDREIFRQKDGVWYGEKLFP